MLLLSMFMSEIPSLLSLNRQRIIKSEVKNTRSRSSNISVLIKEGVFFTGESQRGKNIFLPFSATAGFLLEAIRIARGRMSSPMRLAERRHQPYHIFTIGMTYLSSAPHNHFKLQ